MHSGMVGTGPERAVLGEISPENETHRSSEPSGGSGDASPSSPGCPPSPVWSVLSSERSEDTHG